MNTVIKTVVAQSIVTQQLTAGQLASQFDTWSSIPINQNNFIITLLTLNTIISLITILCLIITLRKIVKTDQKQLTAILNESISKMDTIKLKEEAQLKIHSLEDKLRAQTHKYEDLERQFKSIKHENNLFIEANNNLESNILDLKHEKEDLFNQVTSLKEKLRVLKEKYEYKSITLEEQKTEIEALKKSNAALRMRKAILNQKQNKKDK